MGMSCQELADKAGVSENAIVVAEKYLDKLKVKDYFKIWKVLSKKSTRKYRNGDVKIYIKDFAWELVK